MTLQTQQTAELLRSFGQAVVVDAHHRRRVVRHDGHPHLYDRPALAFVGDPRRPAAQQAGNDTFDHRAAVATGAGEVHLVRGALCGASPPRVSIRRTSSGVGCRGERLDRVRDAHGENPPGMQRLPQLGVIQGQIPGQRVDGQRGAAGDLAQGVLHFVDQGHHIAGVRGIPHRQRKGEDEARGGLGDNAGFAAKLGGAVALAFANGGNRGIVGIDDFTLASRACPG